VSDLTSARLPSARILLSWQPPNDSAREAGILGVLYMPDSYPGGWITSVYDFEGHQGTLIDDFPGDWIDGVLKAVEQIGWNEGVEYVHVAPDALREMVRLLHPLGGIVREAKPLAEVRPLLITIKGGYALALAEQARRGLPQTTYSHTTSTEEV
jgi:hypothetical protein